MQKKYISTISRYCLIFSLLFCLTPSPGFSAVKMPSFVLKDVVAGETVASDSFAGNIVLVTFFATWCAPCVLEVPNLIELQNKYVGKGFSVVAISVDQVESDVVAAFVKEKGINYPVLMATDAVLRGFGGVYGLPTSFMVNRDGKVVKRYTGYVDHSVFVKDIKQML